MKIIYTDQPTLRELVTQTIAFGSICWTDVSGAGTFEDQRASGAVGEVVAEIRQIITFELSRLLDVENIANEWNLAIETAMETVEALR